MNNYLDFLFVNIKYLRNHLKMTQNDHFISHYTTLFDFLKGICFAQELKWLALFNLVWVTNIETNVKYF